MDLPVMFEISKTKVPRGSDVVYRHANRSSALHHIARNEQRNTTTRKEDLKVRRYVNDFTHEEFFFVFSDDEFFEFIGMTTSAFYAQLKDAKAEQDYACHAKAVAQKAARDVIDSLGTASILKRFKYFVTGKMETAV